MVRVKEKILELREKGFSYKKISKELNCSLANISYHCRRYSLNDIGLSNTNIIEKEGDIKEYYKTHTKKETAEHFQISESSVMRYSSKKMVKLSDDEKKKRNYIHVQNRRQKIKEMSVEYKGGKCIICGYDKCIRSLIFHHKNPKEKDFSISGSKVLSWNRIKEELDKCDLVCSNCHGEIHDKLDKEISGC